jgi:hypothetical protein
MRRLCLIFSARTQVHVPVVGPSREEKPVLTSCDTGGATALTRMLGGTVNPALRGIKHPFPGRPSFFFLKRFIAQTVYRVCTRINYKIVPVTNLNKYLHYGTSGTE